MKLLSIDHVQIAIPAGGEDSARSFYLDVLGFNEIPKPAQLAKRGGVWFQSESIQLHLGIEPNFQPAHKTHPAFIVDDINSRSEERRVGKECRTRWQPARYKKKREQS